MKKHLKSMLAIMIAAFTFASCADVPSPYGLFFSDNGELDGAVGTGTADDPYNVAGAINFVRSLDPSVPTTDYVYIKGIVSRLVDGQNYDAGFGNGTFYISDDGKTKNEFYVFRALYFGNIPYTGGPVANIGDEVIICAKVIYYNGNTPETVEKEGYLYSLNGSTSYDMPEFGTKEAPLSVADAIDIINKLENNETAGFGYVKGKVVKTTGFTASSGKITYYISEDGKDANTIQVRYGLGVDKGKFASQSALTAGDEVVVYGPLYKFANSSGAITPEINEGNYLISLVKGEGGGSGKAATPKGDGSLSDPYNPAAAIAAVKGLTWTSNTDYQSTGNVYVKGKISRIANKGTFTEGGTYGNASFYISEDGKEDNEFYCFRILYLNNTKFNEYTGEKVDIKVGDEVVIYGKLMNYKGNTPETEAGAAYLYSLSSGGGSGGGSDTPSSGSVSFNTNSDSQTWGEATDGTYGSGFSTTTEGLNIGYYKHTSTTNPVVPNANHVRVYKNTALSIASTGGKKMKKIIIGCAPNVGSVSYCFDMAGLEGGANATADKSALTVTWSGSASKVVLHAVNGQVRMEKLTVEFE